LQLTRIREKRGEARSSEEKPRASGGTVELKPPPGIDVIDRMCAEQDYLVYRAQALFKL
jgi:hypothetical protein